MRAPASFWPLAAAALALLGVASGAVFFHQRAHHALGEVLTERLEAAGESSALLLGGESAPTPERMRALARAGGLDAAFLVGPDLRVLASTEGGAGGRVDLLRVDPARLDAAFAGKGSVAPTWSFGELTVAAGYFPVRRGDGQPEAVLAVESGLAFDAARGSLDHALVLALVLAVVGALALGLTARRAFRQERLRLEGQAKADRGEALSRMAATVAHEIRNPLSVIRGNVELMRERHRAALDPRDAEAIADVLGEVERLRGLTDDFLDLSTDRPLSQRVVDVAEVVEEAARATEASFPGVQVGRQVAPSAWVLGDAGRLSQVFRNLLTNAAQAAPSGPVAVICGTAGNEVSVRVENGGAPIPADVRERLFDPFVTTKAQGTGLGLLISRKWVERHGGKLELLDGSGPTVFEVRLPGTRA